MKPDSSVKNIALSGIFTGLAILTKGPVALLVFCCAYSSFTHSAISIAG